MPDTRALLGRDGPIARALGDGYEPREPQLGMASAVEHAMDERAGLLVEAGTGVGKSFAYLVPAIVRAVCRGERVLVSTHTIALQEQLIERDIPFLQRTLEEELAGSVEHPAALRPCLVKGRGNYVSVRRLELASARQHSLLPDAASRRSLHVIEDWAYQTRDGTLSTLPALDRPAVWDRVQSDSGNCMGRKCPRNAQCFYQNARRAMEGANLLVTNHALFFSDRALRMRGAGFLPVVDHVVLDEAHTVEDVAGDHFGLSLTEGRAMHLLGILLHARTRKGYLARLELPDDRAVHRAIEAVEEAEAAARELFGSLAALAGTPASGWGAAATTRVREPDVIANPVSPAFADLAQRLRLLRDELSEDARYDADRYELNSYVLRADEIARTSEELLAQSVPGCVYWIEHGQSGGGRPRVALAAAPIEVGPILERELFGREHSVVLTSATIATSAREDGGFAHARDRLGAGEAETLALGSPFDYASQVRLVVDPRVGSPGRGADRGYESRLSAAIVEHVGGTHGGAFVLFTSLRLLRAMARATRDALGRQGIAVHAQEIDGPRGELLARFREDPSSALFGAASFWQGVDVPGAGLRNVLITRLPFDPPDRPVAEARAERLRERGEDPFRVDALPRAVIRFKQGFGRLVRSASDTGRVVVLDPRIVRSGYGRAFLAAVPEGVPVEVHEGVDLDDADAPEFGSAW
ncbi:MAG: helicase C-terminal domain-containing protein [Planctomycetota bacterium]